MCPQDPGRKTGSDRERLRERDLEKGSAARAGKGQAAQWARFPSPGSIQGVQLATCFSYSIAHLTLKGDNNEV